MMPLTQRLQVVEGIVAALLAVHDMVNVSCRVAAWRAGVLAHVCASCAFQLKHAAPQLPPVARQCLLPVTSCPTRHRLDTTNHKGGGNMDDRERIAAKLRAIDEEYRSAMDDVEWLTRERGKALVAGHDAGLSYSQLAKAVGLTRAKAYEAVQREKTARI